MIEGKSVSARQKARDETTAKLPERIADHELLRVVGSGAYGEVVLARNSVTGVYRAIKIVWRQAFRDDRPYNREFEAIKTFEPISRSHPGLVQILQVGQLQNAFYYIMELADDETSASSFDPERYVPRCLARRPGEPLPPQECISIGIHLTEALSVLHDAGLIHRDIKPSNIIFVHGRPKLADIGLVIQIEEANSFVGTAGFVPPEGPISPASDIYSLGKLLYELATGKDRCEFPELPKELPADSTLYLELNQIVLKACDPRPERRYESAGAMCRELQLLDAGSSIKRLRRLERQFRIAAVCFASVLVLAAVGIALKTMWDRDRVRSDRRLGYMIGKGSDFLKRGDFAAALRFFVAAAKEDHANADTHRLRIGASIGNGVRRLSGWQGSGSGTFTRDGKWFVGIRTNQVEVCDARTGTLRSAVATEQIATDARLSPNGVQLAWAIGSLLYLRGENTSIDRIPFGARIDNLQFSPSGRELAVCTVSNFNILRDLQLVESIDWPAEHVYQVEYSPDEQRLMFFYWNGNVEVWTRHPLRKASVTLSFRSVYAGLFDNTRNDRVLTAGFDRAVYWDTQTGEVLSKSIDHEYGTRCLALSPDAKLLASGGLDRAVRLSYPHTLLAQEANPVLYHPDWVGSVAFIDNHTLAVHCGDGSNHIWELATSEPESKEIPWEPPPSRTSAASETLILDAVDRRLTVQRSGKAPATLQFPSEISAVALHPRAAQFAVGTRDDVFEHHSVVVYFADNLETPAYQLPHMDGVNFVKYSPSGKLIVTCGEEHASRLWNSENGAQLLLPLRHKWQVQCADFSADEAWLATASWDETVIIWDTRTGEPITPPLKFGTELYWVSFANNDRTLLTKSFKHEKAFRMELPFADPPLDRYSHLLPAPETLVVNPGF